MGIDYFGVPEEKRKRKYDFNQLDDSQMHFLTQMKNTFRAQLKSFLKYDNVKDILIASVFDSERKGSIDAYEKFCNENSYIYKKNQIDLKLKEFWDKNFDTTDDFKTFHDKFAPYLEKNLNIQALLIDKIFLDNSDHFCEKFENYLLNNLKIQKPFKELIETNIVISEMFNEVDDHESRILALELAGGIRRRLKKEIVPTKAINNASSSQHTHSK